MHSIAPLNNRQCLCRSSPNNNNSNAPRSLPSLGSTHRRVQPSRAVGSCSTLTRQSQGWAQASCPRGQQRVGRPLAAAGRGDSSHAVHDAADNMDGPDDLWTPVPPTPALGRKRKVALLVAAAMLEITLTGTLVWSPLLSAVALAVLQPTKAEIQRQQDEAVQQAVAAAEVQAYRHLHVTPVESAAWLNRLNQEMWATFWQPFLLINNLSSWQDTVSAAAPKGWEVEIADVSIGTLAPQMSGWQAFADPDTGAVTAVDADIKFNSDSVVLVVVGRGPLGAFTAKVSAVQLEGHIRIIPLLQHRMLLVAFKQSPSVRVSLSLSAPLFKTALSPGDLGQLNFIQGLIGSAIKDQLVEPRRMAISLDSDIRVEQAVSTTLHLTINSITGLPRSMVAAAGAGSRGAAAPAAPRVALVLVDTTTQVRRVTKAVSPTVLRRAAQLQQQLSLELRRKQGLFRLEAREVVPGPSGRGSASRGQLLGSCLLWVAAARDGTTLFWAHDRSGAPLATRWSPASNKPWQVSLPLNPEVPGAQALQVTLGVAVEPWVYKAGLSPGVHGVQRTPGPRVVILQVVEARGLTSSGAQSLQQYGPTTHIQVAYGQDIYRTSTQYGTSSPIFNEVFAFQETPGRIVTNRIKLEVWQDDDVTAAAAAAAGGGGDTADTSQPQTSSSSSRPHSPSSSSSSSNPRRALGASAAARRTGLKVPNKLRHSSSMKSSSKGGHGGGGSSSSSSSRGGDSPVASYQLSDVEPESDAADPESHMLVDLELQDDGEREQQQQQDDMPGGSIGNGSSSSSRRGDGAGSMSLGSTSIELDQLTEALVQDRWFELSGTEGGQVRLRLAVVPGMLSGASSSSSSSRRPQPPLTQEANDDVTHMLAFFHKQMQRSSRDSIKVEVVSARLYLPLSSMDSSDLDQPSYVLSYAGSATVTTPLYSRPARARPSSRGANSSAGSSGSSGTSSSSSKWGRPSGGASRVGGMETTTSSGGGGSSSSSGSSGALGTATSSMFEDVMPGNVSQQIVEGTCLARGIFPLNLDATQAAAGAAREAALSAAAAGSSAAAGLVAKEAAVQAGRLPGGQPGLSQPPPQLKVLLFDPEDFSHAPPAAAAAAIAAAAASSRVRAAIPAAAAAGGEEAAEASSSGSTSLPPAGSVASHPILLSSVSSSSSGGLADIGGVQVDVQQLLAAAQLDGAAAAGGGVQGGAVRGTTAAAACWEGWVKLDKDGGHLLLRLTQLPAAEPKDLVPPIAISSSIGSAAEGTSAAAVAATTGGGSGAAADGSMSSADEEVDQGLQDRLATVLQESIVSAQDQVVSAVHQLSTATTAATEWINSSSSWLSSSWVKPWRTNTSSTPSKTADKAKQQQQQKQSPAAHASSKIARQKQKAAPQGKGGSQQQQEEDEEEEAAQQAASAAVTITAGATAGGNLTAEPDQQQQHKQKQQQKEPSSSFGVDLRFISRALGLGGTGSSSSSSKSTQQQKPTQQGSTSEEAKLQQEEQQQQQAADTDSSPLQSHPLQDMAAEPSSMQQQPPATTTAASSNGSAAANNGAGGGSGGRQQQQQQQGPDGSTRDSHQQPPVQPSQVDSSQVTQAAGAAAAGPHTASSKPGQQQKTSPVAGQSAAGAAAAAAATTASSTALLGLTSHEVPVAAADVWSYDGYGDVGGGGVGHVGGGGGGEPASEWEQAQEEEF